jgi:type IV pilus assembly protein PilQ
MGMPLNKRQQRRFVARLRTHLMVLGAMLFSCSVSFAQETVLETVDINNLAGGGVQLRFQLSEPLPAPPNSFTINDPARIVLDFPNTRNGLRTRNRTIDSSGVAESINVLEGGDRTRASIRLARLVPYTIRSEGDSVLLTMEAGAASAAPNVGAGSASPVAGTVSNVDFRRGPAGGGLITMTLSDPNIPVDVRQEGNQIIAEVRGANLGRGQQRRLDVTDFATPVDQIDALNQGENARITIQPTPPFEYLAYQADEQFTIEVKPVEEQPIDDEVDPRRRTFSGELLSLNFQDIEVRAVLQIIADFTGQNVVVSDTVQGNLTLRLQNVPWDQALDIILRTKGLTMRQNGNVMYIAPTEEVAARERLELEARKTVTELVPLRSELIQINYAKASEFAALLKSAGEGDEASLLSPRGQVTVDPRTNTLLIQDIPDKITEVRNLITRLDRPVQQVLIDSRVVIANDDFRKEIGVRWGFTGVDDNGDNGIITTTGTLEGTGGIVDDAVGNLQDSGQPFPVNLPSLNQRLGVNLGASDPFGSIALAILGKDYLVDLELSALQAEGRGEILSNPRVVTADGAEASIRQGREIPYQTISEEGVNIEFKKAELELTVVPQITPDNRVIMDLVVKKNEQGATVTTSTGAAIPAIDTREIATQVLVDNGQTVVLGGVFEQTSNNTTDKVPLLGDIPGVGRLFQRRTNSNIKRELLIFVTPQIVRETGTSTR